MKFLKDSSPAWCPGCGNFPIRQFLAETLEDMGLEPDQVLMVTGIGQAAKMPHYLNVNFVNGLHGRSIPVAFAAKVANPDLVVIAESGDGCMYGEGGNHMIHGIRRNVDITVIVHDNRIYGLTKGQGSPTTELNQITSAQPWGVINEPLNPIAMGIALNASFVARTWSGDKDHFKKTLSAAIEHKGFSIVDVMHPCVSFNKVNTFAWYKSRLYDVNEKDPSYDPTDRLKAFEKALEFGDKIPMGIIYLNKKLTFHELHPVLKSGTKLIEIRESEEVLEELESFK